MFFFFQQGRSVVVVSIFSVTALRRGRSVNVLVTQALKGPQHLAGDGDLVSRNPPPRSDGRSQLQSCPTWAEDVIGFSWTLLGSSLGGQARMVTGFSSWPNVLLVFSLLLYQPVMDLLWVLSVSMLTACVAIPMDAAAGSHSLFTCEPITLRMCQGLPYNSTFMPNVLNHYDQQTAALAMEVQYSADVWMMCCCLWCVRESADISAVNTLQLRNWNIEALCSTAKQKHLRLLYIKENTLVFYSLD